MSLEFYVSLSPPPPLSPQRLGVSFNIALLTYTIAQICQLNVNQPSISYNHSIKPWALGFVKTVVRSNGDSHICCKGCAVGVEEVT